jgi:hypothetical protein
VHAGIQSFTQGASQCSAVFALRWPCSALCMKQFRYEGARSRHPVLHSVAPVQCSLFAVRDFDFALRDQWHAIDVHARLSSFRVATAWPHLASVV